MSYLLSEKQSLVLQTVDRFGVLTSSQLTRFLKGKVSHVSVYDAKRKLVQLGFLSEEKLGRHLIIFIRPRGVSYLGSNLTTFTKLNYTLLNHTTVMNDCIIELLYQDKVDGAFPTFHTEREIRSNFIEQNFDLGDKKDPTKLKNIPERIPDFIIIEDGKRIAYEVELTQKAKKRYVRKFELYRSQLLNNEYNMIVYLCASESTLEMIEKVLQELNMDPNHVRLELIDELI